MFEFQGMWLPDGEQHFQQWMAKNGEIVDGRGTYQIKKWRACLPWIRNWRTAVDVGAHVGFWSIQMVARFGITHAFEPVAAFRECFDRNLGDVDHDDHDFSGSVPCVLRAIALGAESGRVAMRIPALGQGIDSGGTHVGMDHGKVVPGGDVEMRTLDSFEFQNVDFIKIDCEGFEHHVIDGARATLERCKPCVIVEQKPHKLGPNFGIKGTPAVDRLRDLGAILRAEIGGDYILSWN